MIPNPFRDITGFLVRSSDECQRTELLVTALSIRGAKFIVYCSASDLDAFQRGSETFLTGLRASRQVFSVAKDIKGSVLYGLPWIAMAD